MLVKGCYSFSNDNIVGGQYRLTYQGKDYSARDAVAKAKVKYVFINMGTNDLYETPEKVYERYKNYIKGIQKKNPGIRIFIESTTPVFHAGQKGGLNNKNVNRLNKLMEKYCNRNRDLYFIDITTALKDSHGGLAAEYCSDHYVHITMSGYRVWTQKVCAYVKHLLIQEKKAKIAVKYAKKRKIKKEYMRAKRLVGQLEKSTLKTELTKKLKGIKYD
jgi:lysophospholipase L1-like esterase